MPLPIEVVSFSDPKQISELSSSVWLNYEPGFQIDGVNSIDELFEVFDIIRTTAPTEYAKSIKFDGVYPENPDHFGATMPRVGAHVDGTGAGLAIHQNMSRRIPVKLAYPKPSFSADCKMDRHSVSDLRVGETIPGRLTVFSEGGYDWLASTAHHFIRDNPKKDWVRYTQEEPDTTTHNGSDLVQSIARAAFAKLNDRFAASDQASLL